MSEMNSFAQLYRAQFGSVDLDFVLDINAYSADGAVNYQLSHCLPCNVTNALPISLSDFAIMQSPQHIDNSVRSHSVVFEGQLDIKKLEFILDSMLYSNGKLEASHSSSKNGKDVYISGTVASLSKVYRVKGVLHISGSEYLHILQAVHEVLKYIIYS